jgi:hypothetical protein
MARGQVIRADVLMAQAMLTEDANSLFPGQLLVVSNGS